MTDYNGTNVALTSGGMDSTVAAHIAIRWGPADLLIYLDTTTGARQNRRYVERLADHLGVQLWTLRTHKPYAEWVRDRQEFPGDGLHHIAYRRLKEPQIDKLYSKVEKPLHLWTGIRAFESDKRLASAASVEDDNRRAERYWHNPIHDWSKRDCRQYIDRFHLPRNYLWRVLGRSGDCYCGCYGSPEELLDLRAAGCVRAAERLEELQDEIESGNERGVWAWSGMSNTEQRAERAEQDRDQMRLCSTCGMKPLADGGHP